MPLTTRTDKIAGGVHFLEGLEGKDPVEVVDPREPALVGLRLGSFHHARKVAGGWTGNDLLHEPHGVFQENPGRHSVPAVRDLPPGGIRGIQLDARRFQRQRIDPERMTALCLQRHRVARGSLIERAFVGQRPRSPDVVIPS